VDFKTNSGIWGTMFGVPCIVADNFLKLATGEQIKVLLYILRCSGKNCTDELILLCLLRFKIKLKQNLTPKIKKLLIGSSFIRQKLQNS